MVTVGDFSNSFHTRICDDTSSTNNKIKNLNQTKNSLQNATLGTHFLQTDVLVLVQNKSRNNKSIVAPIKAKADIKCI